MLICAETVGRWCAGDATAAEHTAPSAAGNSGPELVAPQPARLGEHITAGPAMDPVGLTQVSH